MSEVGSGSTQAQDKGAGWITAASVGVLLLLVLAFGAFAVVRSGADRDLPRLVRFMPGGIDRERTVPADEVPLGPSEYSPSGGARGERDPSGGYGGTVGSTGGMSGGPTGPTTQAPGGAGGGSR